jgi:hypothetical protein
MPRERTRFDLTPIAILSAEKVPPGVLTRPSAWGWALPAEEPERFPCAAEPAAEPFPAHHKKEQRELRKTGRLHSTRAPARRTTERAHNTTERRAHNNSGREHCNRNSERLRNHSDGGDGDGGGIRIRCS